MPTTLFDELIARVREKVMERMEPAWVAGLAIAKQQMQDHMDDKYLALHDQLSAVHKQMSTLEADMQRHFNSRWYARAYYWVRYRQWRRFRRDYDPFED